MFRFATLLATLPLALAGPISLGTRDSNPGCSNASFRDFHWTVKDFDYHASYIFTTPAHQNSWGYVNFTLVHSALLYTAQCSAASNQLSDFFYGTVPYNCAFPEDATPSPGTGAKFDFSRPSGLLEVNQTWVCSDADPQYPTTFWAYGAVNLTLDCTDTTWTNPNWTTPGTVYSSREVKCNPVTVPITDYRIAAAA